MNCHPELTYSIYADGELPAAEARQVEAHLESCARCRALVAGLGSEAQLLAAVLQEPEGTPAAAPLRPRDILWTALGVVGAAAGLQAGLDSFSSLAALEGTGWLNPLNLVVQFELFTRGVVYFFREGVEMLTATATTISLLTGSAGLIGGALWWLRRRQKAFIGLVVASLLLFLALPAAAVERRHAKDATITIRSGEIIDDTLVASGDRVVLDGTVTGNLVAMAGAVEINGTVKGDLVCFGGGVDLKGRVEGNVFVFAGGLKLAGQVEQSVYAWAGGVAVEPGAQIGGNLMAAAGGVSIDGTVKRDAVTGSGRTQVTGTVGQNLAAFTGKLTLERSAHIGGDLYARVSKQENVQVEAGTVRGKTDIRFAEPKTGPYARPKFYFQRALGIAISLGLGLLLYWLFPALFRERLATAGDLGRSVSVGFLFTVATPVLAILLGLLLLGIGILAGVVLISLIPVLLFVFWLLALYLAKILVAHVVGQKLLPPAGGQPARFALPLLAGLALYYVLSSIPFLYFDIVIRIVVALLGTGLALNAVWRAWKPAAA